MAEVNNKNGIQIAKEYLEKLGVDTSSRGITSSDIVSIFDIADSDNDGSVNEKDFQSAVENYYNTTLDQAESEYLDAWENFAGQNGNSDNLSYDDLSYMNASSGNSSSSASLANSAGNTQQAAAQNQTGVVSNYQSVSLSGNESLSELQSGRKL